MKLNNLQALRAIAAMMVFFLHLHDVEAKYGGSDVQLLGSWTEVGAWGVDLFFVLSGFVMMLVTMDKKGSASLSWNFLYARVTRIYPLWWACFGALLIFWFIAPELVYGGKHTDPPILKDFFLIIHDSSPLLETGWTLRHELYFYVVFGAMLFFPINLSMRLVTLAFWLGVIVLANLVLTLDAGTLLGLAVHPMTLEFIGGAFAAWIWHKTKGAFGFSALLLGLTWFFLGGAVMLIQPDPGITGTSPFIDDWFRVLTMGPSAILIVYGAAALELKNKIKAEGLFVSIGDWSYSLYLTHMLTLNALGIIWGRMAHPSLYDNLIALPAIIVICIAVSWISYRVVERPSLRLTRALVSKPRAPAPA